MVFDMVFTSLCSSLAICALLLPSAIFVNTVLLLKLSLLYASCKDDGGWLVGWLVGWFAHSSDPHY